MFKAFRILFEQRRVDIQVLNVDELSDVWKTKNAIYVFFSLKLTLYGIFVTLFKKNERTQRCLLIFLQNNDKISPFSF